MQTYNVLLCGAEKSGKSCIAKQCSEKGQWTFDDQYSPTIEDSYKISASHAGSDFVVEIKDPSGAKDNSSMRVSWISKADWFIIVFDLTDKQTLTQDAADWFTEISNLKSREERNVLLVGNKGDLNIDIEVTGLEALEWAEERGIEYLEVSAKSYDSVVKAFNKVLKLDRAKNTEKEQEFSIVVCGGGETGKSAISVQFYRGVFLEEYDPTIEDTYIKEMEVDGNKFKLRILDTAGQKEFSALRETYAQNSDMFMIVFDRTRRNTLDEDAVEWFDLITKFHPVADDVSITLVGNKSDLTESIQVSTEQAQKWAQERNINYVEISAKNVDDCAKAFNKSVKQNDHLPTQWFYCHE